MGSAGVGGEKANRVGYHPAYLLRNLPEKARAWADLCLALDVMKRQDQAAPSAT